MKNLGFTIKDCIFHCILASKTWKLMWKLSAPCCGAHDSWFKVHVVASLHSTLSGKMKYSFVSSLFGVYPNIFFLSIGGILFLQILTFIDMHHKLIFNFCIYRDINRYIIKIRILIPWFKHSKELFWNIILLLIWWMYMCLFKIKRWV